MDKNPYNGEEQAPSNADAHIEERSVNPAEWRGGPVMVGDVILHSDIITEHFCCDIAQCQGRCCEEGDAGAPVTLEEIDYIEGHLDDLWPQLSASAQSVIDRQGVAYPDPEGEMVTSIVDSGNCVFRGCKGCLLPVRPMSCSLYPIREKKIGDLIALNYHRWDICRPAMELGKQKDVHLYEFLREPLIRRFGKEWYDELELTVHELHSQHLLPT